MDKTKIAIIGGGILGSTVAYYLAKNDNWQSYEVTLFDDGVGQATSAAAGIISPWVSKRRNKRWYQLAKDGAELVHNIASETQMDVNTYQQSGTIITRSSVEQIDELFDLATQRRSDAPQIGDLKKLSAAEVVEAIPMIQNKLPGLFISGGARIDGASYANHLIHFASKRNLISEKEKVTLTKNKKIKNKKYNKIIICSGAWMQKTLLPLNLKLAIYPQKGQLIQIHLNQPAYKNRMPVLMPEGECDFIPINNQEIIIGATHENNKGFDLTANDKAIDELLTSATSLIPDINRMNIDYVKVGTRAYTDDFAPYFGALPGFNDILVGGGLGSSGLTTGPMIAKLLASAVIDGNEEGWEQYTKPIANYLI